MSSGADRLAEVTGHIAEAARASGRSPSDVTLVAVSKTHGADRVRELLEVGHRVFGENRVQEAEGKFPELLSQLALNRLDLVIADEPMSRRINVRAFNHSLGRSNMAFFATPALATQLQGPFPESLSGMPMLIPGAQASVRQQLEAWLTRHSIAPRIVGEFDDGALMTAFGRQGRGIFMVPSVMEAETMAQYGVQCVGRSEELLDEFFAVSVERRITHPCVVAITDAARGQLFG